MVKRTVIHPSHGYYEASSSINLFTTASRASVDHSKINLRFLLAVWLCLQATAVAKTPIQNMPIFHASPIIRKHAVTIKSKPNGEFMGMLFSRSVARIIGKNDNTRYCSSRKFNNGCKVLTQQCYQGRQTIQSSFCKPQSLMMVPKNYTPFGNSSIQTNTRNLMAFVGSYQPRPFVPMTKPNFRNIPRENDAFPLSQHYSSSKPSLLSTRLKSTASSSASDESPTATSAHSTTQSKTSFPEWWPLSNSLHNHIKFSDYVAHVVVPNLTATIDSEHGSVRDDEATGDASNNITLTFEQVIQWAVRVAQNRTDTFAQLTDNDEESLGFSAIGENNDPDYERRRMRIDREWIDGESASELLVPYNNEHTRGLGEDIKSYDALHPSYRHDPSLLPKPMAHAQMSTDSTDKSYLNAVELLALGSIWHLPYTSSSHIADRFDPSSGIKPQRLNVGDLNRTVCAGDYFRVHFHPRRFVETNLFDWGSEFANDFESDVEVKPGIIVARDDEAGYLVINKPPNVPVHPTVDNELENVASSIGRMLWVEKKELLTNHQHGDLVTNNEISTIAEVESDQADHEQKYPQKSKKKQRKQKKEPLIYVATPQRLDQNTSGLLVVATKKSFASYFAWLLRTKTTGQLLSGGKSRDPSSLTGKNGTDIARCDDVSPKSTSSCGVHKSYRCLVCVSPSAKLEKGAFTSDAHDSKEPHTQSMITEVERLKTYATEGTIIKHFLEPSIRAPKNFVAAIPGDVDDTESWAECLLKITKVGDACTVVGNVPSDSLAKDLWGNFGKPDECVAVIELEIELLTGRTHQIRGQMAAEGFPLVGDASYGGAVPSSSSLWLKKYNGSENRTKAESYLDSEHLALQCSSLDFLNPYADGSEYVKRSDRWNSFKLDQAFWTSFLKRYQSGSASLTSAEMTSSFADEMSLMEQSLPAQIKPSTPALPELPPRVILSPGTNKYIVVRATLLEESRVHSAASGINQADELWFVRSASPLECGGPYHANVAEEIMQQLQSLGYKADVMGGGRIDFCISEELSHAHVFGFSYGFGKGNHQMVASIIEQYTDIVSTFDNSDGLY